VAGVEARGAEGGARVGSCRSAAHRFGGSRALAARV